MAPANTEERIVWYSMLWTYGFYVLGALYVVAPVIAWVLFLILCKRALFWAITADVRYQLPMPFGIQIWFYGMFVMLIALIVGHLNNDFGIASIIKSTIGWAKGWALLALFPMAACLDIRPALVYRAACIVCLHTLILVPVFVLAWLVGLPETLYTSPLQKIGGPGPEYFSLNLYEIDPSSGGPRWRLFAPWAPAIGFVANIYFIFALQEQDQRWRWIGIAGCLAMIFMSGSRLALVAVLTVPLVSLAMSMVGRPTMLWFSGLAAAVAGTVAVPLMNLFEQLSARFRGARADSSRVREALGRIAVDRWRAEAPIWGHGQLEIGPHLVEFMMIGSHHSWYGLLFVKGLVGFFSLLIPMAVCLLSLWRRSMSSTTGRVGLSMLLILFLYTFGENLEVLAYLAWPGLLLIGLGCRKDLDDRARIRDEPVA